MRIRKDNIEKILKEQNIYLEVCSFLKEDVSLIEKYYCWLNKLEDIPRCKECGSPVKFRKFSQGYREFCSAKCSNKSLITREKVKDTCLERYGATCSVLTDKSKQTCLEKYGVDNYSKYEEGKREKKLRSLEKYGVDSYTKTKEFKDKFKSTCLEKYGVDNPSKVKEFKDKFKSTCLERFGHDNPMKVEAIRLKTIKTFKQKYGYDWPFQSQEVQSNIDETFKKKYNAKRPLSSKSFRDDLIFKKRVHNVKAFLKNLSLMDYALLNDDDEEYIIKNKSFDITCLKCGSIISLSGFRLQDINCNCRNDQNLNKSRAEDDIRNWLKDKFGFLHIHNRSTIPPYELDIYIPDHKLAIEYNGLYWHCELNKDKNYHLKKTLACQEKGIQLIHIFENEWLYKQDIVKSIIKAKLGIFDERIYARKCEIQEIGQDRYNEFLEANHLQGKSIAKVRLGLFYNDELVSVIGFGKSRFKKGETELIRFANKLNTSIIGGFSKLLKYYIKTYDFDKLVSYCDLRYFDGAGYLKNGFEIVSRSNPNYYYWKQRTLELYSRQQFQKHKLKDKLEVFDENLSEHENLILNKYYRIYDCGNLRLEYKCGKILI